MGRHILVSDPLPTPRMPLLQTHRQMPLEMPFVDDDNPTPKLTANVTEREFKTAFRPGGTGAMTNSSVLRETNPSSKAITIPVKQMVVPFTDLAFARRAGSYCLTKQREAARMAIAPSPDFSAGRPDPQIWTTGIPEDQALQKVCEDLNELLAEISH